MARRAGRLAARIWRSGLDWTAAIAVGACLVLTTAEVIEGRRANAGYEVELGNLKASRALMMAAQWEAPASGQE